jgi:MFS family permease
MPLLEKIRTAYPNPLATRFGRGMSFFSFYFIDGVLIGFMAMFIAMQMKTQHVGVMQIGFFVATLYLPSSWNWLFGPIVDLCYSERLGRRRGWILVAEALIILALLVVMQVSFVTHFKLFTAAVILVSFFAALQRIAVNALACTVLSEQERGRTSGMMYTGAYMGQIVGGSGVILLSAYLPLTCLFLLVIACVLAVMLFVALPLREPQAVVQAGGRRSGLAAVGEEVRSYAARAFDAFRASRAALVTLIFVLLPAGAWAMSLSLGTNLMVELGMRERERSLLTFVSILVAAGASFVGGMLADRFGRRKTLALSVIGSALPALWMAYVMHERGWVMSSDESAAAHSAAPQLLIVSYWVVTLLIGAFQGFVYTARSALFMDICTPAVAATQFTAYAAMVNLTIVYTSAWQGCCLAKVGYPATLAIDALLGIASLPLLLLITRPGASPSAAVAVVEGESESCCDCL